MGHRFNVVSFYFFPLNPILPQLQGRYFVPVYVQLLADTSDSAIVARLPGKPWNFPGTRLSHQGNHLGPLPKPATQGVFRVQRRFVVGSS